MADTTLEADALNPAIEGTDADFLFREKHPNSRRRYSGT
jgi:hypothetical protein